MQVVVGYEIVQFPVYVFSLTQIYSLWHVTFHCLRQWRFDQWQKFCYFVTAKCLCALRAKRYINIGSTAVCKFIVTSWGLFFHTSFKRNFCHPIIKRSCQPENISCLRLDSCPFIHEHLLNIVLSSDGSHLKKVDSLCWGLILRKFLDLAAVFHSCLW